MYTPQSISQTMDLLSRKSPQYGGQSKSLRNSNDYSDDFGSKTPQTRNRGQSEGRSLDHRMY